MNASEMPEKMPEAEVSLRLAFYLIEHGLVESDLRVAIDGAQIKTADIVHFNISEFLCRLKWHKQSANDKWQDTYSHDQHKPKLVIHSKPGCGDVVATLVDGRTLRVECKKGPLIRSKSSPEYRLFREALGQLLTMESVGESDLLAVAVPSSPKFEDLACQWQKAPLISRLGLLILTVSRDHRVFGLPSGLVKAPSQ